MHRPTSRRVVLRHALRSKVRGGGATIHTPFGHLVIITVTSGVSAVVLKQNIVDDTP